MCTKSMHRILTPWLVATVCLVWFAQRGVAQKGPDVAPLFRISGSATITGDVYDFSSSPDGSEQPRRPANLWRFLLNPVITIGDAVTLPFTIMLSTRETSTIVPALRAPTFLQFLQNPANNLGVLSFSPRVGWAKASLGSHVPTYSELSTGNEQLFGLGLDLKPGFFRIAVNGGASQRAIEADSANGIRGSYARRMYAMKLGYGQDAGSFIDVNIVRAKDEASSVQKRPKGLAPEEGLVFTTNYRIRLADAASITGEVGGSAFTRDLGSELANVKTPVPGWLYRHRISTSTDFAGTLMFNYTEKSWGVKAGSKYIGAGYFSLAYPYMQPDRLDFLLAPYLKVFKSRLAMNGSIGYRTNNLSKTKDATSHQIIGSFNAFALVSENVSVNTRFANYGIRNRMAVDTLKLDMVTNSFSVSPTVTIPTRTLVNTFMVNFSIDAYNEINTLTASERSNNTTSVMGMYMANFTGIPLSANLTGMLMKNDVPNNELTLLSATAGVSYRFLNGALRPSASATWSVNSLASYTADRQFLFRVGAQCDLGPSLALGLFGSMNSYRYGSTRPGVSFRESFLESSLSVTF